MQPCKLSSPHIYLHGNPSICVSTASAVSDTEIDFKNKLTELLRCVQVFFNCLFTCAFIGYDYEYAL